MNLWLIKEKILQVQLNKGLFVNIVWYKENNLLNMFWLDEIIHYYYMVINFKNNRFPVVIFQIRYLEKTIIFI